LSLDLDAASILGKLTQLKIELKILETDNARAGHLACAFSKRFQFVLFFTHSKEARFYHPVERPSNERA
jgi:hypothetical protein